MKKLNLLLITLILLFVTACKSAGPKEPETTDITEPKVEQTESQEKALKLIKYPGTMLWEIDGYTQNGEPSKVYFLGTYHAGDGRMDEYPECVASAIKESERFCCEISSEEWAELPDLMTNLTNSSFLADF